MGWVWGVSWGLGYVGGGLGYVGGLFMLGVGVYVLGLFMLGGGCEANFVLKLPARFAVLQITGTRA